LKKELMNRTQDPDFQPEANAWDGLTLIIADQVQEDLDKKLMSPADMKEAIWLGESSGHLFYDEADGMRICSLVKPVITYWVQYRQVGPQTYDVFGAYYHRMRFKQGE
jgi:hypothetical protein